MRFLFICGSMESGRDGVGDYTRRLSLALIKSGHYCSIIAINDPFVSVSLNFQENHENEELSMIRLPPSFSWKSRIAMARSKVAEVRPDWISLQFVPYSFDSKGLPFRIAARIHGIVKGYKFHVMFHELWIESDKSFKSKILNYLQKKITSQLKPDFCHVSILYNQSRLKDMGVHAEILPLFGNIEHDPHALLPAIFSKEKNSAKCWFLYFGSPPTKDYLDLLSSRILCQDRRFQLGVVIIGEASHHKQMFIERLSQIPNLTVIDCGFLKESEISALLGSCDIGISRATTNLLGKSGSAIAMLEHGMPVWLPKASESDDLPDIFRSDLVFTTLPEPSDLQPFRTRVYQSLLPKVAQQFVKDLSL